MKKQILKVLVCVSLIHPFWVQVAAQAAIISSSSESNTAPGPGAAHWLEDGVGWRWRFADGNFAVSEWVEVNGRWYHFDAQGYMQTGLIILDGVYYWLDEDGSMAADGNRTVGSITYTFDSTGAGTMIWPYKMPLQIPSEAEKSELHKTVDAMADTVLSEVIDDSMGERQKAEAIYHWVKGHLRANGYSPVGDWVSAAWDGLRKRHGDCYTYYATAAELLNRAGFRTIEVIRSTDNNHYWNLVEVDGEWYHFDAFPRLAGGEYCLLTDKEIAVWPRCEFDHSLYPPTP